ncbi:MAG: hypothetical protein NVS3B28_30210 [Candidatus Velthaea sp.]
MMNVDQLNDAVIAGLRADRDACIDAIRSTIEHVDALSRNATLDPARAVNEAIRTQDLYQRVILAVDYLREIERFRFTALDTLDPRSPLLIYARALADAAEPGRAQLAVTILQTLRNMVLTLEAVTTTSG